MYDLTKQQGVGERLASLEANVGHLSQEVHDLKTEIGKTRKTIGGVYDALNDLRETAFTAKGAWKASVKWGAAIVIIAGLIVAMITALKTGAPNGGIGK